MDKLRWYFECPECEYDSGEAGMLADQCFGICPLCAGDTGRDVKLKFRPPTIEELRAAANPSCKFLLFVL